MMRTFLAASGTALVIALTMTAGALADDGDAPVAGQAFDAPAHMTSARESHTATLLPDGKVLLAGGYKEGDAVLGTAELYDPATGTSTAVSMPMVSPRASHTATLLRDGKVLLAGGADSKGFLNTAELYDPATGTFTATGSVISDSLISARVSHTATLLPDGKVLVVGGFFEQRSDLYDPATGAFSFIDGYLPPLVGHTATLLPNGKVLVAGGYVEWAWLYAPRFVVDTAELYDPASRTFTQAGTRMTSARYRHTATLLPNGKVLLAGGAGATAELYDPATDTFTATRAPMTAPRSGHAAALLPGGKVLLSGGFSAGKVLNSAELYDPATNTFMPADELMSSKREAHTATTLLDGKVLIAGGSNGTTPLDTMEVYDAPAPAPPSSRRRVVTHGGQ